MMYQIMTNEAFREEVQSTVEDWNDGRDSLDVEEVLRDLLSAKPDPQWGIIFDSASELENRTDRFSMAIYTENDGEAQKALDTYFGEEYGVFSMRDMAEAIVKSFYDMKELL